MIFAWINVVILFTISALHIYWASGGTFGKYVAIPENDGHLLFVPGAPVTLVVAMGLAAAALFILFKVAMLPLSQISWIPEWLSVSGLWILGLVFLGRAIGDFHYVGFFKKVKNTKFARFDSIYYSPLCLLLAFNSVMIAITY